MRSPVTDWEHDFDHFDKRWTQDPAKLWSEIRATCPVATSQRFEGGAYFPLRYADIYAIAYDSEHFSSQRIIVREQKLPVQGMPPITSDPPVHTPARRVLLPPFAPKEVARHEPLIRQICVDLLDNIADRREFDAAVEFAQHLPTLVITHMLGVDEKDADLFRTWIYVLSTQSVQDPESALSVLGEIESYFKRYIKLRRQQPADDLITYLVHAEIDGEPLTERHIIGSLLLLVVAGIDTTWSALGASLWHLATHPEDRRRLVAEPELLPSAIEEFLRAYSPVTMAREVVEDTHVGGCPYAKGGQVLLSFAAANRDPEKFNDPDSVIIDRALNPHAAFGLGRHRCLGSNLARLELTVALQEWLKRFPEFDLVPGSDVIWSEGQLRGPRTLNVMIHASDTTS